MDTGMDRLTMRWERRDRYFELYEEYGLDALHEVFWDVLFKLRKYKKLVKTEPSLMSTLRHYTYMWEDLLLCGVYKTHKRADLRRFLKRAKKMVHVSKHEKMVHKRFMAVVDRKSSMKKTRHGCVSTALMADDFSDLK
jgi:hypothetical protein